VEVRRLRWLVSDIQKTSLPDLEPHHMTDLISVEDDAFDKHLQIIWEL
jgi:hypothetical protein